MPLLEVAISFLFGLIASGLVGYYFYNKSEKASNEHQFEIMTKLVEIDENKKNSSVSNKENISNLINEY